MKAVVITGASSMISMALIEECLIRNTKIYAVVHSQSKNVSRLPKSDLIKTIVCDFENYYQLPELVNDECEIFYNFAWKATGKMRNENPYYQIENIQSTLVTIDIAVKMGCKKYIGAGSQAEYGKADKIPIGPDSITNPNTPYGITKYAAGKLALYEGNRLGIECIWTRIFSIYGRYDKHSTMIIYALDKLLRGEIPKFTKGENLWDFLYYSDAGKAFYLLGEYGKGGEIYCIGSNDCKPLNYFISMLRDSIDPNLEIQLGKIPYPPDGPLNICANIQKLTQDTGFTPKVTFEEGIKLTIDWYKTEKLL